MCKKQASIKTRRGLALVLVLFAASVVFVLSLAFVATQNVSVQVTRNITSRAQARMIAESGAEMAISYVLDNDNWRNEKTDGLWLKDYALAGGKVTIYGEDGEDTDEDGIVEGDGNLSNFSLDLLTVTAVGSYQGAQQTARAIVFPRKRLLMVVPDPNSLTSEGITRRDLLKSWGWTVYLLRAKATVSEINAALAQEIHVIYFPAHTSLQSTIKDVFKQKTFNRPIISENSQLVKELAITDSESKEYTGNSIRVLELSRVMTDDFDNEYVEIYDHYITEAFPIGDLTICTAAAKLLRSDGKIIGAEALAARTGDPNRFALLILEAGALRTDKKPSPARRAALPWGAEGKFFISSLNENGLTILRRSLDWSGGSWKGMLPGLASWDKVEIKDSGIVDGFDSTLGPYGGGNVNAAATVSTNKTDNDKIKIEGGTLLGDVYIPPGADASKVVRISGGGTMTGRIRRLDLSVPVGNLPVPTDLPGETGDRVYSTGTNVINSNLQLKKLTIQGDAVVEIQGDVTIFCNEEITIKDNARLILSAAQGQGQGQGQGLQPGSLTLYSKRDFKVQGNAQVNTSTADPTRMNVLILRKKIEVLNNAQIYATVQGYDAEMKVRDNGQFYGAFVGKKVKVEGSGGVHVDTSITGTVVTMGSGIDLGRLTGKRVRWMGQP